MQVTFTMSKEEFDEYQAKISEYHATIKSNDKLRAYSEKLEREVAEFREAFDKIASLKTGVIKILIKVLDN